MTRVEVAGGENVLSEEIVGVARDLIAEKGLAALSMRAIAERVGVSAPALYHYFDGKDALVARVVQTAFARFGEYMEHAMRSHPPGSFERVRALGEAYMTFALENLASFRVIFSIQVPHPRDLEDLPGGGGYPLLRRTVIEAMESGAMRPGDPDLASLYLWSMVHGLVTLVLACRVEGCQEGGSGTPSPQDLLRRFQPFLMNGLMVPTDSNEG
ncbi:MAG TPA: TetR/AcrR family transcriptional regulator [Gemmatimonadales bacterium]